jgi:hypothetical protein
MCENLWTLPASWPFLVHRPESDMPLNWNFPAIFGPENREQVIPPPAVVDVDVSIAGPVEANKAIPAH